MLDMEKYYFEICILAIFVASYGAGQVCTRMTTNGRNGRCGWCSRSCFTLTVNIRGAGGFDKAKSMARGNYSRMIRNPSD